MLNLSFSVYLLIQNKILLFIFLYNIIYNNECFIARASGNMVESWAHDWKVMGSNLDGRIYAIDPNWITNEKRSIASDYLSSLHPKLYYKDFKE